MFDKNSIPKHVAIIMDGNGRWAKQRGLPRTAGHREGIKRIKEIVNVANNLGIEYLTFFVFSTENWNRPKREIDMLMHYLDNFLKNELEYLKDNNIRLIVIGREKPLPHYLLKRIKFAQDYSKNNKGMTLIVALNYGARQEIVDAVKRYALLVFDRKENPFQLDEEKFSRFLYTQGIPDPDLLIRTSGEIRVSNFLLWQISYTEFYFTKKYWPDFKEDDFLEAIYDYQKRQRRFGRI
ncbi:MAG: isoprenyl transferase [Candidatus Omnitrophica bacterium]|nr:isoprenyl transferase [Candidatus Omnitrophota bacterium]